ncbi:hypothetical protein IPM65_00525 [Candidatus Roizmanbacteria bacterium]|nr:MAG: hypothetical protein IPM65_00525 [Candidatus Roizmanbacteria bacterium]
MLSSILKKYGLIVICAVLVFLFGRSLNPFDNNTFLGHDETQPARIIEFAFDIRNGHIPPRISPHMSFGMGYPIFNYYAPTAYWITSSLLLAGLDVTASLEVSYLAAFLLAFIGMYLFLKKYFNEVPALIGGLAYVSSPFIAVDIFIRGNLAEMWFFALFPFGLWILTVVSKRSIGIAAVILAFVFTSHNIFSLVSVPLLILFALIQKNRIWGALSIALGLLLSSYFLIPALSELKLVQASDIATITQYQNHFLCPYQVWYSQWGFGGSSVGCINDGMSFMLGKIQILAGLAGLGYFFYQLKKTKKSFSWLTVGMAGLLLGSFFMTTAYSLFLWKAFEPILSVFQFPWRFLLFVIFGLAFFTAYLLDTIPKKWKLLAAVMISIGIFYLNPKFFTGNMRSVQTVINTFASDSYIFNTSAFKVAEYLPITADYEYWRTLEGKKAETTGPIALQPEQEVQVLRNEPFEKIAVVRSQHDVALNIHYAPYWIISREGKQIIPTTFDKLGRPIIDVSSAEFETITIRYQETMIEHVANGITAVGGIIILIYSYIQIRWHRKKI